MPRLAELLRTATAANATYVGICTDADALFATAVRSCWDARVPFVPLDRSLPPQRVAAMLDQVSVGLVLLPGPSASRGALSLGDALGPLDLVAVAKGEGIAMYRRRTVALLAAPPPPSWVAYVVFTSGTTGVPKPVFAPRSGLESNARCLVSRLGISSTDRILQAAPIGFDPSLIDVFVAAEANATLVASGPLGKTNKQQLATFMAAQHVTVLFCTPSFWARFARDQQQALLRQLRCLVLGGEAFPAASLLPLLSSSSSSLATVYNIYGTTECSVWATLQRVDVQVGSTQPGQEQIPIGEPLDGTVVEVRNGDELWIGGDTRRCAVRPAEAGAAYDSLPAMRFTGDVVRVIDGKLFIAGRRDRMFKRNGKRAQLEDIEALIVRLGSQGRERGGGGVFATFDHDERLLRVYLGVAGATAETDTSSLVRDLQMNLLPEHLPDEIYAMPEPIPVNCNGKIDGNALESDRKAKNLRLLWPPAGRGLLDMVAALLPSSCHPTEQDYFVALGGESMAAARLLHQLSLAWNDPSIASDPHYFNVLFHETLGTLANHLDVAKTTRPVENNKRAHDDVADGGGDRVLCQRARSLRATATKLKGTPSLSVVWSYSTGKCVDASPLVASVRVAAATSKQLVFIGSHSHLFTALDVQDGSVLWQVALPDRIEASAALCAHRYVCVGCYDGAVYFFEASSGTRYWSFQTSSQVKCSPTYCSSKDLLIVGSHDHSVYFLNVHPKTLAANIECDGAIFAQPAINENESMVFVASLGGTVYAISLASDPRILWSLKLDGPIFSSPNERDGILFVATVAGSLYAICATSQRILWKMSTSAPIFSSPCIFEDARSNKMIAIACHDGHIKVVDFSSGRLVYEYSASPGTAVYSSPSVVQTGSSVLVSSFHTNGMFLGIQNALERDIWEVASPMPAFQLPGPIFSSPVSVTQPNGNVGMIVGCRDNNVYCINVDYRNM